MKKSIFTTVMLLIMCSTLAQDKKLSILGGIGYTTETKALIGSTGLDLVYTPLTTKVTPFIASGWSMHNTLNEAPDYGHLSVGLQVPYFSISAGLLVGNNQQKRDIHVENGVTKILKEGAKTSNFTGQQYMARVDIPLNEAMSAIGQVTFVNGKTMYRTLQTLRFGVRIYIC